MKIDSDYLKSSHPLNTSLPRKPKKYQVYPAQELVESLQGTEEENFSGKRIMKRTSLDPQSYSKDDNEKDISKFSIRKQFKRHSAKRASVPTIVGMEIGEYMTKEISGRRRRFVENARKTHYYFEMLKVAELGCSIYACIGLIFSILAYDIDFISLTDGVMTTIALPKEIWKYVRSITLYIVLITSLMQVCCVIVRYKIKLKWMKARKIVNEKYSLLNSREKVYIFLELTLISLMPYPFFEGFHLTSFNEFENINTIYSINDILTMTIFFRVFYVLRLLVLHSHYFSNSAHRLFLFTKSKCSYTFVMRSLMKNYPLQIMLIVLCSLIFFFAYLLKISERPLIYAILMRERINNPDYFILYDLSDYTNCLWLMIITITTVGYGDYNPGTISGRLIIVGACGLGIMTVSLIVIIFQDLFKLTTSETRALAVVEKMIFHKKRKKHAGAVITNLGKLGFFNGKTLSEKEKQKGLKQIKRIKENLKDLHKINEKQKDSNHNSFFNEELSRRILFIKEDLEEVELQVNIVLERCLNMLDNDVDFKLNTSENN